MTTTIYRVLVVLAAYLLVGCGCSDVIEFFEPRPCVDECKMAPGFQNCQFCKCQEHQKSINDHVCCQGETCNKNPSEMNAQCLFPDDGKIHLRIDGLRSSPVSPKACTALSIDWAYVNQSSGSLGTPSSLGINDTVLRVQEVGGTGPDSEITRQVPWGSLAACGVENRSEAFTDGLVPSTSTLGTYAIDFLNIPADTPGRPISIEVDSTNSPCPTP